MHDFIEQCLMATDVVKKKTGSGLIDFFSVSYPNNKNDKSMIFKPTDETVVSDSVTP
jgi:hypothetical protein